MNVPLNSIAVELITITGIFAYTFQSMVCGVCRRYIGFVRMIIMYT